MHGTLTLLAALLLTSPDALVATAASAGTALAQAAWAPRDSQAEFVHRDHLWIMGGWFDLYFNSTARRKQTN